MGKSQAEGKTEASASTVVRGKTELRLAQSAEGKTEGQKTGGAGLMKL